MKISRITVFQIDLPLEHPYWLSGGRLKFETLDATLVKVETDAGIIGWGEGTPWGHTYVPAHGPGIRAGIRTMAPFVLGLDPRRILDVERAMDTALPGHLYAKSPVDMACWDIAGQAAGLSIADLMGGGSRTPRAIASSVGATSVADTRAVIERYRARGYVAHSVKIGGDVERDIARIRDVESIRRDGEIILYDVNRGWSRQQALRVMSATQNLQVMFEQPCESLDDIASIAGKHAAPVSVDESLVTLQDAARIARDGLAEVFGIKLNRVGGLTKAARMRDIALAHGIDMFVMATGGTVLADTEALHLAATVPDANCHAVWACQDMITTDIAGGRGPRNIDGHLRLPETPGLGVHPDEDTLGPPVAVFEQNNLGGPLNAGRTSIMHRTHTQAEWIERARSVLPAAGFGNFDSSIVISRGEGSHVWDEDGNEYIDYLIGSGPMLLGHGHPEVIEAVLEQLPLGMTFFANNARGIELAEAIVDAVPCCEQVRFVTSGGEADMYAIRLARAHTRKTRILKFEGGYHGMSAEAQMSLAPARRVNFPTAVPDSAGIPQGVADEMLIAPFNDLDAVASLLAEHDDVAAIIVEPLQRIIPARPGFLQGLRNLCDKYHVLLIFDEIVTGFRLAYGGAQERYGVTPDICTLGKIIGGGFALAALGARTGIMDHFDKSRAGADNWLMQLGTLSGNPVAAAAGLKTMEILRRPGQYDALRASGQHLIDMQSKALDMAGIAHRVCGDLTLFDLYFTSAEVVDYRSARHDAPQDSVVWNASLRNQGLFKSAAKLYPSLALSDADLQHSERAFAQAARAVAEGR